MIEVSERTLGVFLPQIYELFNKKKGGGWGGGTDKGRIFIKVPQNVTTHEGTKQEGQLTSTQCPEILCRKFCRCKTKTN